MWAVQSIKFGYRWQIGDGAKIGFSEDIWFGTSLSFRESEFDDQLDT
jgi:hypothetical protein